jgi:hypothetical protein
LLFTVWSVDNGVWRNSPPPNHRRSLGWVIKERKMDSVIGHGAPIGDSGTQLGAQWTTQRRPIRPLETMAEKMLVELTALHRLIG